MDGNRLDRISTRLNRVQEWLGENSGYARAADLQTLLGRDLPDLIRTVRDHNLRGRQGRCVYCGQQLRMIPGYRAGLYATTLSETGVICEDPNCPSPESPDGKHEHVRTTEGAGQ